MCMNDYVYVGVYMIKFSCTGRGTSWDFGDFWDYISTNPTLVVKITTTKKGR